MDITSIIGALPLFDGLASDQCAHLASIASRKYYARSQSFFSEGDEANGFYVILSGRVKIFKLSGDGKEQILHILESPEPFGEAAVFAGEHFPASAQAIDQTQVLFFPKQNFVNLIRREPTLALSMLALLSKRLRKLTTLVENLSLKEVPGRLAAYLLQQANLKGTSTVLELNISKNQLAGLLGTIPETLSRIFRRMADEGLIRSENQTLSILDPKGLGELAEGHRRLG